MVLTRKAGFVLPFILFLSTSALLLATLILEQAEFSRNLTDRRMLNEQARQLLKAQALPLVNYLSRSVLEPSRTTAMVNPDPDSPSRFRTLALKGLEDLIELGSSPTHGGVAGFRSLFAGRVLQSGWQGISPETEDSSLNLAWAAEDLSLHAGPDPPPVFWPLPSWNFQPMAPRGSPEDFLDGHAGVAWSSLPWVPRQEPLPFLPESSPALVPVPTGLELHFGIFASGPTGSREKVVRIRYYLTGNLWNPYNRPMDLHVGSGLRPVMQMVWTNLPRVRIHNRTRGYSTSWIELDLAANDQTGAQGLHGWIRGPQTLERGQSFAFVEPDPEDQPEGLARTLHPAFQVGPADTVEVEFRPSVSGISLALLNLESGHPVRDALSGQGWFRVEGFPVEFSRLEFPRADEGPQPFYLSGGSLAFRREHCRGRISMARPGLPGVPASDPRKRLIQASARYPAADGTPFSGTDLVQLVFHDQAGAANPEKSPIGDFSLVSWPGETPADLFSATDLPQWEEGFRLGTEGAGGLNGLFEEASFTPWVAPGSDSLLEPVPGWSYHETRPVNLLSPEGWRELLQRSVLPAGETGDLVFPAFMAPMEGELMDFIPVTRPELESAAENLALAIRDSPSTSVGEFFTRGRLGTAFRNSGFAHELDSLLPLRAWLRRSPPLVRHGSAWILHLAVRRHLEGAIQDHTARVWLLDTPDGFAVIRFEWTDPDAHLIRG